MISRSSMKLMTLYTQGLCFNDTVDDKFFLPVLCPDDSSVRRYKNRGVAVFRF
jgi:hypothetical protein